MRKLVELLLLLRNVSLSVHKTRKWNYTDVDDDDDDDGNWRWKKKIEREEWERFQLYNISWERGLHLPVLWAPLTPPNRTNGAAFACPQHFAFGFIINYDTNQTFFFYLFGKNNYFFKNRLIQIQLDSKLNSSPIFHQVFI